MNGNEIQLFTCAITDW